MSDEVAEGTRVSIVGERLSQRKCVWYLGRVRVHPLMPVRAWEAMSG